MKVTIEIRRSHAIGIHVGTVVYCMRADLVVVTSELGSTLFARNRPGHDLFRVTGKGTEYTDAETGEMLDEIARLHVTTDIVQLDRDPPTFNHPENREQDTPLR